MSKDFENFLVEQGLLTLFKLLPMPMKKAIEDRYYELKESEEKKNVECEV